MSGVSWNGSPGRAADAAGNGNGSNGFGGDRGPSRPASRAAEGARPVRVLVVDDREGSRSSLISALAAFSHLCVAGGAGSGDHACRAVVDLRPDVVLLDLTDTEGDGLETARRIRQSHPDTPVLVMTASDGPRMETSALAAGASMVVPRATPFEDVVGVILDAAEG